MLRRLRWKSLTTIIVVVGLAITAIAIQKIDTPVINFQRGTDHALGLELGLDLAGGTHLVYQAGDETFEPTSAQMEGLIDNITRRVDSLGVAEPSIQKLGDDRLVIQLPGIEDVEEAKELIGATAQLEIIERLCFDATCAENVAESYRDVKTGLTGANMARASAGTDQLTNEPVLLFELKSGDARAFAILTQRIFETNTVPDQNGVRTPDQMAFVLDGRVLVSAGVSSPILAGNGQIRGRDFTPEGVRRLAIQVESGRLPIEIHELSSTFVNASLGAESFEDALLAGLVGLVLVVFFMTAYYRLSGVIAAVALVCYIAIVLAIFKLFPITLTLAGLAGFVLSLGMAVDANILIFERMKEELRIGRNLQFAMQIGFNRAWTSIRDGNISTVIIALVLFFFGSGTANSAVTGFAVALLVGVLTSMFTAIFISKNLLTIVGGTGLRRFPSVFSPEGRYTSAGSTAERDA